MLSYKNALSIILQNTKQLSAVKMPIEKSAGYVLAEDIKSGINMPPFDKSAMDGYALKAQDIKIVPANLKCIGKIPAGEMFEKSLKSGQCVKIMTGAPIPKGADSVAMVEFTSQVKDNVEIKLRVKKGDNVCRRGEDIYAREKVLERGRLLSSSHIAVLASVGRKDVKVIGKPLAAVLNTGGEIVPAGRRLGKNKIYNSNGPMHAALLNNDRIDMRYLGIARDEPKDLSEKIKKGLNSDILMISGGVSMGDYDLVPGILKELGVRKIFHKIKIKPGKPLFFGKKGRTLVFGIPGNPVSNFLSYLLFVRPAIFKMLGYPCAATKMKQGILTRNFKHKPGRRHFVLVKIENKNSGYLLTPVNTHGSADIIALSLADGFMMAGEDVKIVKAKSKVQFITWKNI